MSDWKNVQYKDGKMRTGEGGGGGSSTLAGLDDVSFSNIQNGQVPKYNSTTQKWENANESGGGGTVTDVQVDGVSVVNQQGVAEIEMPTPPTIPVEDVLVNGTSVVDANKEAQIKSYKEVTQSEYNALPASKTSDGILYCIKDSAGADGFPPLIYSDEEREVGVWRDGKPLYVITLVKTGTFATGSYVSHDVSDLNIDTMVELYGWAERFVEGSNITIWHPLNYYEGANYSVVSRYNATSKTIDIRCVYSSGNLCRTQIFNIYYTKTTDTAGSGTWTTQGGYAHHYSTTEHVIGTWIDNKPLYERVLINTQVIELITDTWVKTEFDKGSMGKIIKCSLTNLTYLAFHSGLSAGFVDDKLAINSARSMNYAIGDCAIVIQYTKTTD